ncbi:MAG TPA: DNA recombination protein RmuC [Chthoniobacterales bacterium]|nr:DNA recombination protein RmuC [Chthoniobacterales bacterium]
MSPVIYFLILGAFLLGVVVAIVVMRQAKTQLSEHFRSLSLDALQSNSKTFVQIAKAELEKAQLSATSDLEKRQLAIGELVKPVRDSLDKLDTKIHDLEKARTGAYASLTEQVRSLAETQNYLRDETGKLVQALRSPIVRGRWGEVQLRRVVELAGMVDHCDFIEQETFRTEEGRVRPDLIVYLPGGKTIVVDSKTPLNAYLEALEAADDATRVNRLQQHAAQVRDHIEKLSRKAYWDQFDNAPDFIILFLPGEMFFSAALERDPLLIEFGAERLIILATPTTLIALLRAVSYGWKQEKLTQNALAISQLGAELYKRLSDMGVHFSSLSRNLNACVNAFNKVAGNIETRVFVTARKFNELGAAGSSAEIEPLEPVEQIARDIQAPELLPRSDERSSASDSARS